MAVASFYRKCKWIDANGFSVSQVHRLSFFHNLQVGRAEEFKASEEANVIDDYNEHNPFAFKKCRNIPDFKHIDRGDGFLIESDKIPALIKPKSISLGSEAFAPSSVEDLWKTFLDDTSKWFDHRKIKRNNRFPDFRHKYSLESLWIDCKRTPDWVLPRLKSLQDEAFAPSLSTEDLWKSFFGDPSKWHDYRKTKKSNKLPDFVHKDTTHGLWIEDMKNPPWIIPMLKDLGDKAFAPFTSTEVLWKIFFDDPSRWFDYRKTKKSCKHPDFKHKENGEALWIEDSKTPDWVFAKLNDMWDEAFVSFQDIEDRWKFFFADPSKWIDYRKMKKSNNCPDFVHKETTEGLWIDATETPFWLTRMVKELPDESVAPALTLENLWLTFFDNPSKWFDNRKTKKRSDHPDFKHTGSGEALWIKNIKTPAWVFSKLNDLWDEVVIPSKSMEDTWKALFADPLKWFDYRKIKKYKKMPDFRHKDTRESLWIRDKKTPSWVIPKLADLPQEAFTSFMPVKDLWISVFVEQSQWLDFRKIKRINSHPDFMRKDMTAALWIENTETPAWVKLMLQNLKSEAFSPLPSIEHLWKSLVDDPSKWWDNRELKKSINQPDFVNRNTYKALWIDDQRTPNWVLLKLSSLKFEAFARHNEILAWYEDKWKAFFANPSKWFDNRTCKVNPKAPDFRHKDTKETLWIASKWTPNWVVPCLSKLQNKLQ